MLNNNPYLENLQERVVQEKVLKLIHANNPFQTFEKKNIEYHGAYGEYIGDQPLEGVEWNKNLTTDDFKTLPEVFSCYLPIFLDKVYYSIQNKKVMKRALQSPELMAELSERLIDSMKTQATKDIRKKVIELLCEKDKYNDNAWIEWEAEDCELDDLDKAIRVISWIKKASSALLEESQNFNKGYQKPNSNDWNKVETNSESKKSQVLIIDPDFLQEIETRFLSAAVNLELVSLKAQFKEVIERKLENKVKIIIRDENSFAYTIINEEGITTEQVFGSGSTKFGYHVTVVGGVIPFVNAVALVSK